MPIRPLRIACPFVLALAALSADAFAQFGGFGRQGFGQQGFGQQGMGGFGLGGLGRRGFMPRQATPFTPYAVYYQRLSGRQMVPLIPGIHFAPSSASTSTDLDPLLEELGLDDDRQDKRKRRSDIDPSLRRWPTWVDVGGPAGRVEALRRGAEAEERPQASECYFVRMSDRVELQPAGESGFYPLEFWDTSRRLGIGSRVRLSGRGRAYMLFSDGTQVEMVGAGEVAFVQGTLDRLVLEITRCSHAFVRLGLRGVEVRLPDASVVRGRRGSFELQRLTADVGTRGGEARVLERLELTNWGSEALRLAPARVLGAGADAGVEIPARRRTLLMLVNSDRDGSESQDDLPKTIPGGGVAMRAGVHATLRKDRRGLQVEARSGEAVLQWAGTRMRVPVGTTLRIDPLLGDPFQETSR